MKYLDAKRRLIFMMATVKYIRLLFKNEITITDDEIKLIVAKSLPLIFKDYTIKVEDVNEIVEGIKSCVLRINNSLNISKISQEATIETIRRDRLRIEELISLSDLAKLVTIASNAIHSAEEIIKTSSAARLIASKLQDIKNDNIPVILEDKIKVLVQKSIPLIFEDKSISTEDKNILVEGIKSLLLKSDDINKTNYEAIFDVIRRDRIVINSYITFKEDILKLITAMHSLLYVNDINSVVDETKLNSVNSNLIYSNTNNKILEYLNLVTSISSKLIMQGTDKTLDNVFIDNTVNSIAIAFKDNLITTKSEVLLDLITSDIEYIDIDEELKLNDLVSMVTAFASNYQIEDKSIIKDKNKLRAALSKLIISNDINKTIDYNLFLSLYSDLIKTNELILTSCGIDLNSLSSRNFVINDKIKISNDVVLTLGDFISLPFEINTKLIINEKLFFNTEEAISFILKDNTIIKESNLLRDDESRIVKNYSLIDTDCCLQILKYRYSLLRDWDPIDMDTVLETNMVDLIFVKK